MQAQRYTASYPRPLLRPIQPKFFDHAEASSNMLIPDLVLAEQFYNLSHCPHKPRGEIALLYAVLSDAVRCFRQQTGARGRRAQHLMREADEWFFANDYRWPFSFVNICAVLGLDPAYIRLGLKQRPQYPPAKSQKKRRCRASGYQLLKGLIDSQDVCRQRPQPNERSNHQVDRRDRQS